MGRAPCCQKVGLKRGRWTVEEDELLVKYIQANGEGSWRSLPKNAGLLRCGKSCRLRWINYLRADLKRGNISSEEEEIIVKMHGSVGNRWSLIAGHLPGRTDNEIKNYWNSHLSRRIHTIKKPNDEVPVIMDIGKIAGGPRRRGGKTSRSKKSSLSNVETRKGEEIDNLGQEGSSTIPSDGPQHDESGAMMGPTTPLQLLEEEIFICPDERIQDLSVGQFLDGEISGSDHAGAFDGMEFLEMDSCMLDGPNDQEVENGAIHMGELSKDASDQNGVVGMGGEASSSNTASSCFDQIEGLQDGWLDWEWDEVLEKVMDDGENTCYSSSWENHNGISWEGDCHSALMESHEHENFSAWLLKQDINITM